MMSILAPVFLVAFLLTLQAPILQFSCAFTGARPPRFARALLTALLAGLLSTLVATAWGCTFGVVISLFSTWLAWGLSVVVWSLVSGAVYRKRLKIPFRQAMGVAVLHQILSSLVAAAAWFLYGLF